MRPYKITTPRGIRHIDLDHVLSITEPVFIDDMNYGGFGYFAEFSITMAFLDKPIHIRIKSAANYGTDRDSTTPVMIDGVPEGVHQLNIAFKELYNAWVSCDE